MVIFVFFFFLFQQLITALNIESWARGIARSENKVVWEFLFGDMRRLPSLISVQELTFRTVELVASTRLIVEA